MYDSSLKHQWDNQNVLDYAKEEAKEEGRKQGRQEGLELGEYKKALDIARELKKEGLCPCFIAKTTKMSIDEIGRL